MWLQINWIELNWRNWFQRDHRYRLANQQMPTFPARPASTWVAITSAVFSLTSATATKATAKCFHRSTKKCNKQSWQPIQFYSSLSKNSLINFVFVYTVVYCGAKMTMAEVSSQVEVLFWETIVLQMQLAAQAVNALLKHMNITAKVRRSWVRTPVVSFVVFAQKITLLPDWEKNQASVNTVAIATVNIATVKLILDTKTINILPGWDCFRQPKNTCFKQSL